MNKKLLIPTFMLSALIGGAAALGGYKLLVKDPPRNELKDSEGRFQLAAFNPEGAVVPEGLNFIYAAESSTPAVVHVKTVYDKPSNNQPEANRDPFGGFFEDFFGGRGGVPQQPRGGSGSGVIISEDGYIITNNHVVGDANNIEVVLSDRRSYEAEVIGKDPTTDLALIKINEKGLTALKFADSDKVKVGEWVLAVGNPFNLTSTVTAGIVSAKARNINILRIPGSGQNNYAIEAFIQTDAAVNPGNSGGALVNLNGDLIGINTAIATQTGSFSGYSFAVPARLAKKVADDLLEYGEVQRALLGVNIQTVDAKLAKEKDLKDIKGVYIAGVNEDGAADEAGIKEGDVIVKINDTKVNTASELQETVAIFRPGDKISITLLQNGKEKVINAKLKNKMGNTNVVKKNEVSALGATLEPVTKSEKEKLEISGGMKITALESGKLRDAGIKEGFIITHVDKTKINSLEDIRAALSNSKGNLFVEGVYSNGKKSWYVIE